MQSRQEKHPAQFTVSRIYVNPLKSAQGESVKSARVLRGGFEGDHQFMVVDAETGMFVAQRRGAQGIQIRNMRLIQTRFDPATGQTKLSAPRFTDIILPAMNPNSIWKTVQIWKDRVEALVESSEANEWATDLLAPERPGKYQVVRISPLHPRFDRSDTGHEVRFQDAFAFTVMSTKTHEDVNYRLCEKGVQPIPIGRWRTTITIKPINPEGEFSRPYFEDRIESMQIGSITFSGRDLCPRCVLPCVDQNTGVAATEPSATLVEYRRGENLGLTKDEDKSKIYLSRNFNHLGRGIISVGDKVTVLETGEPKNILAHKAAA